MANCQHIRCEPFTDCQLNTVVELAYVDRGDGTGSFLEVKSIRALVGYVEQREGVTDVLGCGCTKRVECGYHREQSSRVHPAVSHG